VRAADGPRAAPFGFTRIVFLSHVITAGGPTFPGDPPVEIRPAATIERDGYHLQSLVAGEQAGTHWAAPAHFAAGQAAADELDPGDPAHSAVIMWTGFEDRWDDPPAYLNADAAGHRIRAGSLTERADRLLVDRWCGVKVPLPPIDGGDGTSTPSAGRRNRCCCDGWRAVRADGAWGNMRGGIRLARGAFLRWDCIVKLSLHVSM
jgi:hypothetical protein